MSLIKRPMRYAHFDGHTDVCFNDKGEQMVTCGNDGDVRIWCGLDDDDPVSHCVGQKALSVAMCGGRLYVGTDDNKMQAYSFIERDGMVIGLELDGTITRFTAPVTHVAAHGDILAACSADMEIRVVNKETDKTSTFTGHKGPVFGIAIDPKGKYIASSSGDGDVRVWDVSSGETVHTWHCVPQCNSFYLAETLGRPSWQPDRGSTLAVPQGTEVVLYKRDSWQQHLTFKDINVQKPFTVTAFSACGVLLAACTASGDIVVWDVIHQTCLGHVAHESRLHITSIAFNPSGNGELAFCDFSGQFSILQGCSTGHKTAALPELSSIDDSLFAAVDDDSATTNCITSDMATRSPGTPILSDLKDESDADDASDTRSIVSVPSRRQQRSFQPSATPTHLQHRFMVWNCVGLVRCTNTESEHSIDIEFNDSSVHYGLHLNNLQNHSLAALTISSVVLACESTDDSPSQLMCIQLDSWDGTKDWTTKLPEGECVLGVAAGLDWIAASTSHRLLRIWSSSGVERMVTCLAGEVLCIAGQNRTLLVVCHTEPGCLVYCTVSMSLPVRMSLWQPVPLSRSTTLQWLGFSDEGSVCTMDSEGMVRMRGGTGCWYPVCNTGALTRGKSDHYFVLAVSETEQNVRAVLCKGSHYPTTTPRPPLMELPMQIPMCELSTDKTRMEQELLLATLTRPLAADVASKEVLAKEATLKLFALACRSDRDARALDYVRLTATQQVVQLATKYALGLDKQLLAEKLSLLQLEDGQSTRSLERTLPAQNGHHSKEPGLTMSDRLDDDDQDEPNVETSLLLAARQAEPEVLDIRPMFPSQKMLNPFRKASSTPETGRGLDRLTEARMSQGKSNVSQGKPKVSQGKPNSQTNSTSSKTSKTKPANTFMQWFSKEKSALQEEFPNMSSDELTLVGVRRFKEVNLKGVQNASSSSKPESATESLADSTPVARPPENECKKRKLGDDVEPKKQEAKPMRKLLQFSFKAVDP